MIRETTGDILLTDAEALVNPVRGMGAGPALQFKHRYPDMFAAYAKACYCGQLVPGIVIPHRVTGPATWVISFPTKRHWQDPSRIEWIDQGLVGLKESNRRPSDLVYRDTAVGLWTGWA